jgi:hypothetical protein
MERCPLYLIDTMTANTARLKRELLKVEELRTLRARK